MNMKRNKVVLLIIYAFVLMAASILFLIDGSIYIYYIMIYYSYIEVLVVLLFPAIVGSIGVIIGGYLLTDSTRAITVLLTKKATADESNESSLDKKGRLKISETRKLFKSLHAICNITIIMFLVNYFSLTIQNETWDELYKLIFYFVGYGLIFMMSGIFVDRANAKNKSNVVKRHSIEELFLLSVGIYCLVINIVIYFSLLYLIACALLLALELARFIYLIIFIFKKSPVEENLITNDKTNNTMEFKYKLTIKKKDNEEHID